MRKTNICLVVGGSGGIGSEICRELSRSGFSVAIGYYSDKRTAENLEMELKKNGAMVCCVNLNVNSEKSVQAAVAEASKSLKGEILYLVYTPGDNLTYRSVIEMNWSQIEDKINLFSRGLWYCLQTMLSKMKENKFGRIVVINTSYSWGVPPTNLADYVIGKYSQVGVMKTAALELGTYGITVNCVSPAMTQTDRLKAVPDLAKKITAAQNPLRRLAVPNDVANTVLFLLGEKSSYLNGVDLPVAGGAVMR